MAASERSENAPAILYFDPNPAGAKLVLATLRLAGYGVYYAASRAAATELCRVHGPGGDRSIAALVLDASAEPREAAALLAAILQIPGSKDLPGMLLVGRRDPSPFPGAENLPQLQRPFSSPALIRLLQEAQIQSPLAQRLTTSVRTPEERLRSLLANHFPREMVTDSTIRAIFRALDEERELPAIRGDAHLYFSLRTVPLAAALDMLGNQGVRGVLTVTAQDDREGRLHLDQGHLLLAEYFGEDEDLKIGRFIVDSGMIDNVELEAFAKATETDPQPLGKRLLRAGKINDKQLTTVLMAQSREVTCHLMRWTEGHVSFRPSNRLHPLALSAAEEGGAALLIGEALVDGLRRIDESAVMGPHMPDVEDIYLRNDDQLARIGKESFDRNELTILEQINGRISVKEVARKTRMGTFAVTRIVYRLAMARIVRRRLPPVLTSPA
jgi:CheY-like chemotaxis protein